MTEPPKPSKEIIKQEEKRIKKNLDDANRVKKALMTKHKKFIKHYKTMVPLQEPILELVRRNGDIEIFENVKKSEFEYRHSDGTVRAMNLRNTVPYKRRWGNDILRTFWYHEDIPVMLPQTPLATTAEVSSVMEKIGLDLERLRAKRVAEFGNTIYKVATGIAILVALFIAYKMLVPGQSPIIINMGEQVANNVSTLAENLTGKSVVGLG